MRGGAGGLWGTGFALGILAALAGCAEAREREEPPVVHADVHPILEAKCAECHSGPLAEADYRVEDYLQTIRCIPDPEGQPATLPSDPTAPILAVLERPDHAGLLDDDETRGLTTWVTDGAVPANRSTHPGKWIDPRADDWHGNYLRETDWQPIVDPERSDACGLCHQGSPPLGDVVVKPPPGATDCIDCHSLPGGVMACGTCHGDGERAYPPRDQCYFGGPPEGHAHDAHTTPSANMLRPLDCQACHFAACLGTRRNLRLRNAGLWHDMPRTHRHHASGRLGRRRSRPRLQRLPSDSTRGPLDDRLQHLPPRHQSRWHPPHDRSSPHQRPRRRLLIFIAD